MSELLQYKLLVIQEREEEIIGIAGVRPRHVLFMRIIPKNLLFLVVKRDYQNQGIGQKLTKKVIQEAMRRNYRYIIISLRVQV